MINRCFALLWWVINSFVFVRHIQTENLNVITKSKVFIDWNWELDIRKTFIHYTKNWFVFFLQFLIINIMKLFNIIFRMHMRYEQSFDYSQNMQKLFYYIGKKHDWKCMLTVCFSLHISSTLNCLDLYSYKGFSFIHFDVSWFSCSLFTFINLDKCFYRYNLRYFS